ncbi:unnamed protein product [marine sediment metagenome]|uniref:Uncharacterized protein n=1 Tax=marine sediment metagenome TaxID=412755 RepID=X1C7X1_9ZZZZ
MRNYNLNRKRFAIMGAILITLVGGMTIGAIFISQPINQTVDLIGIDGQLEWVIIDSLPAEILYGVPITLVAELHIVNLDYATNPVNVNLTISTETTDVLASDFVDGQYYQQLSYGTGGGVSWLSTGNRDFIQNGGTISDILPIPSWDASEDFYLFEFGFTFSETATSAPYTFNVVATN